KAAHDPLRAEQYRQSPGGARRFGMHGGNSAQFGVDLRDERAELKLLRELPSVEIPNRSRLNFCRIDLRIIDRFLSRFDDNVPDRLTFLLQVALKIRAPTAENVNRFHNVLVT